MTPLTEDQIKRIVTLNKITDFSGFEHCCRYTTQENIVICRHFNAELLNIIHTKFPNHKVCSVFDQTVEEGEDDKSLNS